MSDTRRFPLQATEHGRWPVTIRWEYAEAAYKEYVERNGTGQSLERLAERGGFGVEEIAMLYTLRIQRLERQQK